ncbi:uncharacterized protein STEHIDRAFT_133179 [Stereum hirsutum FP-91666 SS1]|uniref:uncharacterized protein n=1 Tax=Stereum hirsutum (strain FP-91666) TaxID=721885 RepID=UPI000444972D|nr:uncharacterized protein STEHIDRAFT_133179 [Stereum hirsutum FP-91666 SS1]EIM83214.1 hypothetical protein STEHIDRAFT_133179 [Stereum hirsutum FP-91666 SS1]
METPERPTITVMATVASHTEIPSTEKLTEISKIEVWDEKGKKVEFGSVYENEKTIVIFIPTVKPEALQAANTKIAIVGCGDWKMIQDYKSTTAFKGSMYADPDRKLYHSLSMMDSLKATPAGEKKKSYLDMSLFGLVTNGFKRGLRHPSHIGKQGNMSQLGGEFIFGPGNTCAYASRMRHTEDHVEVEELMKQAGVAFP